MVKFGKQLHTLRVDTWSGSYVDYCTLKKYLKVPLPGEPDDYPNYSKLKHKFVISANNGEPNRERARFVIGL